MSRTIALVLMMMALVLGVAGCGSDDATQEAKDQLQQDLVDFKAAVDDLAALSPESTIEEIKDADQAVDDAWANVAESAVDVKEAEIEDVEQAWEDLGAAVDDISGDMTPAEAKESISDDVAALQTAYDELYSGLGY